MKFLNLTKRIFIGLALFAMLTSCNSIENTATSSESNTADSKNREKYLAEVVFSDNKAHSALALRSLSNSKFRNLDIDTSLCAGDVVDVAEGEDGKIVSYSIDNADILSVVVEKRSEPGGQSGCYDLYCPDLSNCSIDSTSEKSLYAVNMDYSVTSIASMPDGSMLYLSYRKEDISETINENYLITPCAIYSYDVKTGVDLNILDYDIPETIDIDSEKYKKTETISDEVFASMAGDLIGYICNYEDYALYNSIYGELVLEGFNYNSIYISNHENALAIYHCNESAESILVKGIYGGPYLVYKK